MKINDKQKVSYLKDLMERYEQMRDRHQWEEESLLRDIHNTLNDKGKFDKNGTKRSTQ